MLLYIVDLDLQPLKRALTKMGAPCQLVQSLVPDSQDNSLSYSVLNYLKRLKNQAKAEFDKLCNDVLNKVGTNTPLLKGVESVRVNPRSPLKKDLTTHPCLHDKFTSMRDQLNEFGGYVVGLSRNRHKAQAHTYRNPFDIQRRDLLDQVIIIYNITSLISSSIYIYTETLQPLNLALK